MDNPGFGKNNGEKQKESDIELSSVAAMSVNGTASSTTTAPSQNLVVVCTPEVCRNARQRYQPPDLAGSPWHIKKTIFLTGIIVLLTVWIVVFTILSQLNLL